MSSEDDLPPPPRMFAQSPINLYAQDEAFRNECAAQEGNPPPPPPPPPPAPPAQCDSQPCTACSPTE
eukprot:11437000-Alexandrium_andersonii.AAC.1